MKRGASLLEVLVAAALTLVMLVVLAESFLISSRAWAQSQRQQNTQRSMLTLAYRLRHDYSNSLPGSLTHTPTSLSFLSDDRCDWNEQGQPLWHQWVQYRYTATTGFVERREVRLEPPVALAPGLPPAWPAAVPGVRLADSVSLFEIQTGGRAASLRVLLRSVQQGSSSRIELGILPLLYGQD